MRHLITIYILLLNFNLSYAEHVSDEKTVQKSLMGIVDKYYVGSDNACDFSTIQAAINAASSSQNAVEIRVADNKNYNENLFIFYNNILVDGNYSNCTEARNDITGGNRAKLNGAAPANSSRILISGLFVYIKSMQLQGNNSGGIVASGTSVITLEDMLFFQLDAPGLSVSGNGQIDVRIKNSIFLLNTGNFGGALSCSGSNHSIEITEGSGFASNTATVTGGGVFLQGCDFSMTGGGFQNNSSAGDGGGLAAYNSNIILKNVTFDSNIASSIGGAINIKSSNVNAEAMKFIDNEAGTFGGAISIDNGNRDIASFELKANSQSCENNIKCNYFDGNKAQKGGALALGIGSHGNGSIDISSTFFENNRADLGTVIFAPAGTTKIEGSVFYHNGSHAANSFDDRSAVAIYGESEATIAYSTFADNKVLFSTFKQDDDAVLGIFSSIIYDSDSGDVFEATGPDTTLDTHCLIVHEDQSFDTTNAMVTVADPMFIDPANGDYHINPALSPAVDYCTDAQAMAQYKDIDFEGRGFDDPEVANNFTNAIYDIGADEAQGNLIFANGFELAL